MGLFELNGYERVKAPLVEFEEGLLSGAGAATASETFRLMDPVSQRMMGGARRHHAADRAYRGEPAAGGATAAQAVLRGGGAQDQWHPSPPRTPVHTGRNGGDRLRFPARRRGNRRARRGGSDAGGCRRDHGRSHHAARSRPRSARRTGAGWRTMPACARRSTTRTPAAPRGGRRRPRGYAERVAGGVRPGRGLLRRARRARPAARSGGGVRAAWRGNLGNPRQRARAEAYRPIRWRTGASSTTPGTCFTIFPAGVRGELASGGRYVTGVNGNGRGRRARHRHHPLCRHHPAVAAGAGGVAAGVPAGRQPRRRPGARSGPRAGSPWPG